MGNEVNAVPPWEPAVCEGCDRRASCRYVDGYLVCATCVPADVPQRASHKTRQKAIAGGRDIDDALEEVTGE